MKTGKYNCCMVAYIEILCFPIENRRDCVFVGFYGSNRIKKAQHCVGQVEYIGLSSVRIEHQH